MPYQKHTWTCGEKITTEKLSHIEQGIEDASGNGCVTVKQYYRDRQAQDEKFAIVPYENIKVVFENETAISIAQGQYGVATLVLNAPSIDPLYMDMFGIEEIYVTSGHLPPITSIKKSYDSTTRKITYEVELYARDSAISISAQALVLNAIAFVAPSVSEELCLIEGNCCAHSPQ